MQARIAKKIKNSQCFSYVFTETGTHLEEVGERELYPARILYKQQKGVQN